MTFLATLAAKWGLDIFLGRARQAATGPMGGAIIVTAIACVGVVSLVIGMAWMTGAARRDARTAAESRCNTRISEANSAVLARALVRAAASERDASAARVAQTAAEVQAAATAASLEAELARKQTTGSAATPRSASVCLPADIMGKALGG